MRTHIAVLLLVMICLRAVRAVDDSDTITLRGRVMDASGEPVANAIVSTMWRQHGTSDGSPKKMLPLDHTLVTTSARGEYECHVNNRALSVIVIDESQKNGAVIRIEDTINPISSTVTLFPLTTVTCKFPNTFGSEKVKSFHLYIELQEVESRPLALTQVLYCESKSGEFAFKLPPGEYNCDVYAYTDAKETTDLALMPRHRFRVTDDSQIDLGSLELKADPHSPQMFARFVREKPSDPRWKDLSQRIGQFAPEWHISDSSGLGVNRRVVDYRGKWLLIDFWSLSCAPCISSGIPKLIDFYESHQMDRDKFEIVGVYIDYTSEFKSMVELEKALVPIQANVWRGKQIEFPLVLDSSYRSLEAFGLKGFGSMVLVDPDGRIVAGDIKTLEEKLR